MVHKFLQKIIDFASRTGETVAFPWGGNSFVLLDLDKYEELLSDKRSIAHLTENELLDRINREIALWNQTRSDSQSALDAFTDNDTLKGIHFSSQNSSEYEEV